MPKQPVLSIKSLKEHVYDYLRDQMQKGAILPGSAINMDETSRKLGVSKTPLREALLQLEIEGFVTILPRRGIVVNVLSLEDIKDFYDIIGALEAKALASSFSQLKPLDIKIMQTLIEGMENALAKDDFDLYYERNLRFHDVYLKLCRNETLLKVVNTIKKRLYDFPRQARFVKEWELASVVEHREFLRLIREGRREAAIRFIEEVHWSYKVQERYIKKYYAGLEQAAAKARSKGDR
jgi:DNA-binding GntR family transcriptional regulator